MPLLLLLAAELQHGCGRGGVAYGPVPGLMILLLVVAMIVTVVLGGMRSFNWSSSAQAIAALLALIVPVAIVAVMVSNFPLPQLTHGPLLRQLVHNEASQGVPVVASVAARLHAAARGLRLGRQAIHGALRQRRPAGVRHRHADRDDGRCCLALAAAARDMTPGVYETSKSLGWATVFFGLTMLTAASVSVYMRDFIMDVVKDGSPARLPDWMQDLVRLGFMQFDATASPLTFTSFKLARDTVLLSLPVAAGLPNVFAYFAAAGIVAAALVAAAAATVALGNVLTEDVVNGFSWEPMPKDARIWIGRIAIAGVAALGGIFTLLAPTDPLRLLLWCFAITGSTLFPVLVLSIWWKRMNAFGALAGMGSGFAVAVLTILAGESHIIGLDGALAGIVGLPAGTLGALLASLATPGADAEHAGTRARDPHSRR